MDRNVLLIVPEFPPNNSIGGRRWAKFAKYLAKENVSVKVIAFKPSTNVNNSNWINDIADNRIEVFYLPSQYPKILESSSSNIAIPIIQKVYIYYYFTSGWWNYTRSGYIFPFYLA